ncbi:hypothetical protein [Levilactobacillus bambusae]|uniref:Uncharacterized protein n=1 Tax=Levilactobacillus bambusae TaxID=2024736 RepID=A0A2V1MYB6_9LACO|nr:hypothetical protein [Levilactobacillus bambusae]PWF99497.1 hypothetical protein DCM90_08605 [Levilactobacillus bambusae]
MKAILELTNDESVTFDLESPTLINGGDIRVFNLSRYGLEAADLDFPTVKNRLVTLSKTREQLILNGKHYYVSAVNETTDNDNLSEVIVEKSNPFE